MAFQALLATKTGEPLSTGLGLEQARTHDSRGRASPRCLQSPAGCSKEKSRGARLSMSMRNRAAAGSALTSPRSINETQRNRNMAPRSRPLSVLRALAIRVVVTAVSLTTLPVWADEASPVGLWKSVDDVSGKPRALIRITESNGALLGRIEKVFPAPNEDPNPKCDKCEGANKNAPVVGLVILSGLKKDGDEYAGGEILDPDNGKLYRSKVRLVDNGNKLSVRGYIGVPMLGRSQTWLRQE